ncbi:MAG: FG-GAP-like repeat-containing protein [Nocardioidaceae bacterium]
MRPGQARFVTACQQLLALAAVLAVLTPAASVISLDVAGDGAPGHASRPTDARLRSTASATDTARVPTRVVDPVVTEYALTPSPGQKLAAGALKARTTAGTRAGTTELLSQPLPVSGYGAVGVTWEQGATVPQDAASFEVRTRTGETWSGWTTLPYDPEHAPDPDSREGRNARPGTDPLLVGDVDEVQLRERTSAPLPSGMKMAVIDPGADGATRTEKAAIDTGTLDEPSTSTPGDPEDDSVKAASGALQLQASTYTPKPQIFSRAQWGADERMRDASSLHYFEVHAGFVHHTVNANDYTRAEVPALIRGIYAYHVRSRGWSDIGYNFLVDRFGRIWEGRYGGVDRPVVGAHTLGYNDYAFAMSAIGNFELVQPRQKMLNAYGRLFAWKLSLHGVDASSTSQQVGPTVFQAINGHRDAASTACPGRNLYAKLPEIRALAAADQESWSGRDRQTDLASTGSPDLIMRRASDGQAFVVPTGGLTRFALHQESTGWTGDDTFVATPDVTGDGLGDLGIRRGDGGFAIHPGDGDGGFGAATDPTRMLAGRDRISAAGDLDEDGHNDLVARNPATGRLEVLRGHGDGTFTRKRLATGWNGYRTITGAGDLDGDGHADLVATTADGHLMLRSGTGDGRFSAPATLPGDFSAYAALTGIGDFTHDGRPDLFARSASTGQAYVLPAEGAGYGHPLGPFPRLRGVVGISGADLTGSPEADVVARRDGALVVAANAGTFELGTPVNTRMNLANANAVLNVGDWDRDGHGDVVARAGNGDLYLHLGDGEGHFGKAQRIGRGFGAVRLLAAVGDMTGDGYPDLMGQPRGGQMRIYPGAGLDGLRPSYVAYGPIDAGRQIGVGLWDGDGAPDSLLRKGATLRLFPGNGPGGLVNDIHTFKLDLSRYDWVVGPGNLDPAGHADLVVRERATGYLWLLEGTPGGFAPRRFLGQGFGGYDLVG